MVDTALFIGRFQPFHNGHLHVVKEILKKHDKIIIAVGSAEESATEKNPWTASARMEMIASTLEEKKIDAKRFWILPVRNINNYGLWVQHVTVLTPPFQHIYSGSPIVEKLFKKDGRYTFHKVALYKKISGTKVRTLMKRKNNAWQKMVPKSVCTLIKAMSRAPSVQTEI